MMATREVRRALQRRQRQAARDQMLDGVWRCLTKFFDEHGYSPTLEELGATCGYSKTGVLDPLLSLEERGCLYRRLYAPRGMVLLKRHPDVVPTGYRYSPPAVREG